MAQWENQRSYVAINISYLAVPSAFIIVPSIWTFVFTRKFLNSDFECRQVNEQDQLYVKISVHGSMS